MAYIVTAGNYKGINLAPETLVEEVLQNVAMILSTPQMTVPLNRRFGVAQDYVDKPVQVARNMIVGAIMDAIEEYEPRAKVGKITFEGDWMRGQLIPKVEVSIQDGAE